MRYLALATDFDETLASRGTVLPTTIEALQRVRASGRKLILVTGRQLGDLRRTFPEHELFDRIVAENGAVLYRPRSREEAILAEEASEPFVERLRALGADPVSVGRCIVATVEPFQTEALRAIRELGLELQVVFNRGSVMVLPSGVNKQSGLLTALAELDLSPRNTVAVGDAENDHAMLAACECAVAVENALSSLKDRADWVTRGRSGLGVEELIERLLDDDLRSLAPRQTIALGLHPDGTLAYLPSHGRRVLVAGPGQSGKRAFVTGLLERLAEDGYQCCILDPDGDYTRHAGILSIGGDPTLNEVVELLQKPDASVAVNLSGVHDRPGFLAALLPRLQELRARTGRPHWIVLDEAHELLPASWRPEDPSMPRELGGLLLITSQPHRLSPLILAAIDTAIATGPDHLETLRLFLEGRSPSDRPLLPDEILAWSAGRLDRLRVLPSRAAHRATPVLLPEPTHAE